MQLGVGLGLERKLFNKELIPIKTSHRGKVGKSYIAVMTSKLGQTTSGFATPLSPWW